MNELIQKRRAWYLEHIYTFSLEESSNSHKPLITEAELTTKVRNDMLNIAWYIQGVESGEIEPVKEGV